MNIFSNSRRKQERDYRRYQKWLDSQCPGAPKGVTRRDIRNIEDIGLEKYGEMYDKAKQGIPQKIEFINRDGEYQSITLMPRPVHKKRR